MIKNKEIQARKVFLGAGQTVTVTEYHTEPNKSWTAVFFANSDGQNSITLTQKQLGGGYGTSGDIKYTLGNAPSGNTLTGSGACIIEAIAVNDCELSYYFVDEVYSRQLPPLGQTLTINTDPAFTIVGYPPFGRYYCTIMGTSAFDIRLATANNDLVLNRAVAASFFFVNRSYFMHAPDLQLQVRNSIPNQILHVLHTQ